MHGVSMGVWTAAEQRYHGIHAVIFTKGCMGLAWVFGQLQKQRYHGIHAVIFTKGCMGLAWVFGQLQKQR